jgi:hypothetical protein
MTTNTNSKGHTMSAERRYILRIESSLRIARQVGDPAWKIAALEELLREALRS